MGPTLYNLKCTYILLNSWDPWWFNVSFWAGFQDTCPILISLLFYTLYTREPYIKLNLTKSFCSLKCFFFRLTIAQGTLNVSSSLYAAFQVKKTIHCWMESFICCHVPLVIHRSHITWHHQFCPFLKFTGFIYFCHWLST